MNYKFLLVVIGMSVVTYIPRLMPALGLSNKKLPVWLLKFLEFIPVTVISALLVPSIMIRDNKLSLLNPYVYAAIPTLFAAYKSKNIVIPVVVGLVCYELMVILKL